jgi:galactokinase
MMAAPQGLRRSFEQRYGSRPRIFRAPGRVNLIGEHTDYNDGFVMPMAIPLSTWVAIAARQDRRLMVSSENFPGDVELDLDRIAPGSTGHWSDHARGIAAMLQ